MEEWNSYLIDGTDVLKNKLGITDKDDLNDIPQYFVRMFEQEVTLEESLTVTESFGSFENVEIKCSV